MIGPGYILLPDLRLLRVEVKSNLEVPESKADLS